MKKTITVLGMLWGLAGCGLETNAPVNVYRDYDMNPDYNYDNPNVPFSLSVIRVQANTDQVSIQNIIVNRGECPVSKWVQGNPNLRFGQEVKVILSCDSSQVLQVDVMTDQGEYSFGF